MTKPALSVAVCGLGTVGRETARRLHAGRARWASLLGRPLRLAWVCDRKAAREARSLGLPAAVRRTADYREVLKDPAVDLVVELFGGLDAPRALVLGALAAGKGVVTANKMLLSHRWEEVARAAARAGAPLHFEAAVAGGVPIIRSLRTGLAADRVRSVHGILNGTTNYILTRMAHEGLPFAAALREAQRLGYAERDPRMDLDGTDAAHKVSVLATLLAGAWVRPESVAREGIEPIEAEDIAWAARELKRTARLVGTAVVRRAGPVPEVEAHVRPTLVPLLHPLGGVHGANNALLVSAESAGELMFYGAGAGAGPTATAVLSDVLAAAAELGAGAAAAPAAGGRARSAVEAPAAHYLRWRVKDVPGALARIAAVLGRLGVSLARVHQDDPPGGGRPVPVRLVTHAAPRALIEKARRAVSALPIVSGPHAALRVWPD